MLFLVLCAPAARGQTNAASGLEARGPVPLRNSGPFNLLFLQFTPESPDVLSRGASRYGFQFDIMNNMLAPPTQGGATVYEDDEYQRLLFSWRKGVGKQSELGVFVPILWRNGGILDGILNAWHRFWGIGINADDPIGRADRPSYKSVLLVTDANGNPVVRQGNGFGLGDLSVTLKHPLLRATPRSALALRLGVKLPTGNPVLLLGSGGFDAGLSLDARYNVGRDVIFYANLGGVLLGSAGRVPHPESDMLQVLVAVEYRPNSRDSYIIQFDGNGQPVRTGNAFADRPAVTATFGYKRLLNPHLLLTAAFSENGDIVNYAAPGIANIGPDFTTSLGLEWRP